MNWVKCLKWGYDNVVKAHCYTVDSGQIDLVYIQYIPESIATLLQCFNGFSMYL